VDLKDLINCDKEIFKIIDYVKWKTKGKKFAKEYKNEPKLAEYIAKLRVLLGKWNSQI
jgi:hypothetical protein